MSVRCPILIGREEPAALIAGAVTRLAGSSGPGRGGALAAQAVASGAGGDGAAASAALAVALDAGNRYPPSDIP